jgi:hypothetical protein
MKAAGSCKMMVCSIRLQGITSQKTVFFIISAVTTSNPGQAMFYLFQDQSWIYRHAPVSADSVSAVSVIRGLPWPEKKKNLKIKEINST